MKKILTVLMILVLCVAVCGCGKSKALKTAEKAVEAIGEVTLESGDAIEKAEEAVAALSEEDAEEFSMNRKLKKAREEYDKLVSEHEAQVALEKEAAAVEKCINEMGEVSIDNLDKINEAQSKYDALSAEAKALVKNYDVLSSAQDALSAAKKAKAEEMLASMHIDEDRVNKNSFYYPRGWKHYSQDTWAADIKSFVLPYIGVNENNVWLRMVCNYTGDDWVFFKKVTFSVDGTNYYKSFNYFDIVRDNGGGDVWEYIDTEVYDSDIEILKAIANSNETIVRFSGDNYSKDVIIPAEDKQGIADALLVYELLK